MIVVARATLKPYGFVPDNVDALDLVAAPDGLEDSVGELEPEDVLNGLLVQEVIDPIDGVFGNVSWSSSFSSRAEVRSSPNGFSITIRLSEGTPAPAIARTVAANSDGGNAR